jgi:hypothetical protein
VAFTVQTDAGSVTGANSYISVQEFKDYHDDRGNDYSTYTTPQIEVALVIATDHLDTRFDFVGERRTGVNQATEWPRLDAVNNKEQDVYGIPSAVKEATAEYAIRNLAGTTLDPDPAVDAYGQAVKLKREKVGPIEEETEYAGGGTIHQEPSFPAADKKLISAGLVVRPGTIRRA